MTDRPPTNRNPLPNLRGEDETELQVLTNLIETQSWILFPTRQPTCITGRAPPEDTTATDSAPIFFASLYGMGKGGVKSLDCGPKQGASRKEALSKLLVQIELDLGRMMIGDRRGKRGGG